MRIGSLVSVAERWASFSDPITWFRPCRRWRMWLCPLNWPGTRTPSPAPPKSWSASGLRRAPSIIQANSREGSSSGWHSRGLLPYGRGCCWRMNPRAIWMARPAARSWPSCSLGAAVRAGIATDARMLLGGDLELRQVYSEITPEQRALLSSSARLSEVAQMRAMARRIDNAQRRLVELKAVDQLYPLVGAVRLDPAIELHELLAQRDGRWGAVA